MKKSILIIATFFTTFCLAPGIAVAGESSAVDPHAAHKRMMRAPKITVEHVEYQIPSVDLIDTSGQSTDLHKLLVADKPVVVNFIFTTCTTICPVITATTLQMQRELTSDAVRPEFVSISIDPDYDSAPIMKEYAKAYGADWTFLTGSPENVHAALRALDAYNGNKMNHIALTLMRAKNDQPWTRVEGLTSAKELARIWRETSL